jgi:hypothetical protein
MMAKKPIINDQLDDITTQFTRLNEQFVQQNAILQVLASDQTTALTSNLKAIQQLVRNGLAPEILAIGDQIVVPWTDITTGTQYTMPFDIVHFGEVELKDGEKVPGMFLQSHYATPFAVQFDNYEAFYYCEEELAAGTYNLTMGNSWGTNVVSGKTYQFTLEKNVPAGGQLAGFRGAPDQAPSSWKVYSYESKTATTPLETVTVAEGSGGTNLGTLSSGTKYADNGINNMQRVAYGYNRWSQSAYRQFLNSVGKAGEWWSPQNNFDRAPDQIAKAGFLTGFEEEFLQVLGTVKVTTNLNTTSDGDIGTQETTYDKIFLPSLEQIYVSPQLAGEGEYWEYWKRVTGATAPQAQGKTYPERITYAVENHSSAQTVRLRSAYRGYAHYVWIVSSSGLVYNGLAAGAYRCAPACVIC